MYFWNVIFLFIVIYGFKKLYNKICRKEEFVYLWIIKIEIYSKFN